MLHATVYAPGMTCIYDQFFSNVSIKPWCVCPFKKDFDGTPNKLDISMDNHTDLLINILNGNIFDSIHVFENSEKLIQTTGSVIQFDTLVIESRWLLYHNSLLANIDWEALETGLFNLIDKKIYFIDVGYPHAGSLFDISLVKPYSRTDVAQQKQRNELKTKLLTVLSKYNNLIYVDITAIAGYFGYKNACIDQIDHYSSAFREHISKVFSHDTVGMTFDSNRQILTNLMNRLLNKSVDIEFVCGMTSLTTPGEQLLKLRVVIQPEDPLMCPSELYVSWISLIEINMEWIEFSIVNGKFKWKTDLRPDWLVDYVHKVINIKTMGRFKLSIIE